MRAAGWVGGLSGEVSPRLLLGCGDGCLRWSSMGWGGTRRSVGEGSGSRCLTRARGSRAVGCDDSSKSVSSGGEELAG